MAGAALRPYAERWARDPAVPLRVLDPAMGDGSFLKAAAQVLAASLPPAISSGASRRIVSGCLWGIEIDPEAASMARAALGGSRERLVTGDALADPFPFRGRFQVVIGNPPWGGWDRRLDPSAKAGYRRRFATARGRLDPFALFIETATGLLEPGGRLAFVLPEHSLLKNYPALRRHLLEHYELEELVRWGRAFPGVNLDACSLIARRIAPARPRRSGGWNRIACRPEGPEGRLLMIPQTRFERMPGHVFNLSLDDRSASLMERLGERFPRLGEWLEAHEGIHSGNVRPRLFLPPGAPPSAGSREKPLILGRDEIRPFRLRWSGWRVRYDRRIVRRERGEYAGLGRSEWFESRKILIRRTGDHVMAALDRSGLYASNNLFVALRRASCPVPIGYLEGYLNSALATWCFRALQPRAGRLFAELKLTHLSRLPVPLPGREEIRRVEALAGRIRRGAPGAAGAWRSLDETFAGLARLSPPEARMVLEETDLSRVRLSL